MPSPSWSIINASDARPPGPSTPSLPCTRPSLFSPPSPYFQIFTFSAPLLHPGLYVEFSPLMKLWKAAQWAAQICCVRLARFVLPMFSSVCGNVWVFGRPGFEINGRLNPLTFLCKGSCKDTSFSLISLHQTLMLVVQLNWGSPPLSQGHLAYPT